jgi:hypothetical protein
MKGCTWGFSPVWAHEVPFPAHDRLPDVSFEYNRPAFRSLVKMPRRKEPVMSATRLAAIATLTAATVLATSPLYGRITGAADPGAMDAMSIDMDTTGNTATSLGPGTNA